MYLNESALVAINWYFGWLAHVKYRGSEDQAAAIFWLSEETPLTVLHMFDVTYLLVTLKLGIADSIMVPPPLSHSVYSLIHVNYLGLAMLDHL
jgi:hypothetical protein